MKSKLTIFLLFTCMICADAQTDVFGNRVPPSNKPVVNLPNKPNKRDEQGRRQGEWAKKYRNGRYAYEATFVDDKPVGTVKRYHENGQLSSTQLFLGGDSCRVVLYFENGKKQGEGLYISEKREGEWKFYNENSILVARENYRNGLLHGKRIVYFDTGEVSEESYYIDGVQNGAWIQYFRSGEWRLRTNYTNGKLDGQYKCRDMLTGQMSVEGTYRNGTHIGNWKIYTNNAQGFFYMKYNDKGELTNEAEIDEIMRKKYEKEEYERQFLKDPEHYTHNPEEYKP